jgi:hypothetical protein
MIMLIDTIFQKNKLVGQITGTETSTPVVGVDVNVVGSQVAGQIIIRICS